MQYDGEVIIGSKIDTDGFDDDIKKLEKKGKTSKIGDALTTAFKKALGIGTNILKILTKIFTSIIGIVSNILLMAGGLLLAGAGFLIVSKAVEKVFKDNEQIKTDLQYIVFAITTALDPAINSLADVIEKIVKMIFSIIQYINYIVYALTGKNIFKNATPEKFAEKMAEANKNAKGIEKSAKEINKQFAKFDEMDVLQDNKGSDTETGGGILTPSLDLSKIENIEPPKWLTWILDNGDKVLWLLSAILGIVLALKLGLVGLDAILVGLVLAQVVSVLNGIVKQIKNWIEFIKDPSWDNFFKLIKGFPGTLGLLGLAINEIVDKVLGGWDNIEKTLKPIAEWIMKNLIQPIVNYFKTGYDLIINIFTPIINFFKSIFSTILNNLKVLINNAVEILNFLWEKIVQIFSPIVNFLGERFSQALIRIKQVFSPLTNFMSDLWNQVINRFYNFGFRVGEVVGGAFKMVVNSVISAMENILNSPIRSINSLISTINKVPGINLSKLSTFNLPRLAKGTILNNPGQGVPVAGGRAIAGESGREAYLPLSDSQLLEELGSTIGKYITVNANITNTMNGRIISRELRKINAEDDFAFNR